MATRNTVILADDDTMVRTVMRNIFKTIYPDVRVIEVNNGDAAIEKLSDDIACVIADVMMPERDGIDMCRVIRSSAFCAPYKEVPIVLVSALHASDALAQRAWEAGTAFFMRKPFTVQDLIRTVSSATHLAPIMPPSVRQMQDARLPPPVKQLTGTVDVVPTTQVPPTAQDAIPLRERPRAKR